MSDFEEQWNIKKKKVGQTDPFRIINIFKFFFFFFFFIQFNVPFKIISLIETSQSIGWAKREYPGKTT